MSHKIVYRSLSIWGGRLVIQGVSDWDTKDLELVGAKRKGNVWIDGVHAARLYIPELREPKR